VYRPPVGIPRREQARWQGWLFSLLAHLLLLLFLIMPALDSGIDYGHRDGAGGAGPAGGGGGGSGDAGGQHLQFVQIAPQPSAPAPVATPEPEPPPVLPPIPVPVAPPKPAPTATVTPSAPAVVGSVASGSGVAGAGAGNSNGAGAGSGVGGGVGSGEGPGRGSGVGPGTGGGSAKNNPPTLKQFVLPPLPTPSSVRGFMLTAWFDVDSTGKATLLRITPTPDRGYNNRIRETLLALRFRPAVRPDGVSIRDTVDIQVRF
jgi:protein TonB